MNRVLSIEDYNKNAIKKAVELEKSYHYNAAKCLGLSVLLISPKIYPSDYGNVYTDEYIQQLVSKLYPKKNYIVSNINVDDGYMNVMSELKSYNFTITKKDDSYITSYKDYIRGKVEDILRILEHSLIMNNIVQVRIPETIKDNENYKIYLVDYEGGAVLSHAINIENYINLYYKDIVFNEKYKRKTISYFTKYVKECNVRIKKINPNIMLKLTYQEDGVILIQPIYISNNNTTFITN